METIAEWLGTLGLGDYALRFEENGIDLSVLPDLTDQDLEKIGVLLGHRRKMLRAIAAMGVAAPPPVRAAPAGLQDGAERRQLTVMFCDLVGSTALSARLDPEETREVIRAYQEACARGVASYDGFVAKYMGDGVLVYFGYPRAHEDDAERAVRAGLDLVAAVAALDTPARTPLAARVGIATGLVVVGDLVGEGASREQAVVGDTPNLAARLQALAAPGDVVVAPATRRLLGDVFSLRDLGRHDLKGFAEPVEAWAVLGLASSDNRFETARTTRHGGFVGRETEVASLLERQREAWAGAGQIVLVSGEAGIGKSRLSALLGERLAAEAYTRLRYQCSPYHTGSALYPFIGQIERAASFKPDDAPARKLEKLEAVLARGASDVAEVAPLFAALLSIPFGERYPPLALSPAQQRRQTLAALLDQLEGLTRDKPMLWLFEDAHWADATSLELVDLAVERIRRLPLLALITFRPEFEPPWAGLPAVSMIRLTRMDQRQAGAVVAQVTGGRALPDEVMAQIIAKTDGVPLFIEELTKMVLESGLLVEEAGGYRLDGPLPPFAIPATLQDSLMARLDRMAPVKEIAQIGAVIGREFSYGLLASVVEREEAALNSALAQLVEVELLFRRGAGSDAIYIFKHALVQDAAYESLLKSRRQVLHRRVAEVLRDRFPAIAETEPELVAQHFTQAGLGDAAFEWWGKAGERSLHRSAYIEAIAHFTKALAIGDELKDEPERHLRRLRLQVALGQALISSRGYGAPETTAAFARARGLAAGVEDAVERFSIYYGLWVGTYVRGQVVSMRELAEAFLSDARGWPKSPELGVAHRVFGITCWFQGDYVGAREHLEQALAIYRPERDGGLAFRFGQDAGVSALAYLALVLWPLGEVERARELVEKAVADAATSEHVQTKVYANLHKWYLEAVRRDPARAAPHAEIVYSLAREHAMAQFGAGGAISQGWAVWQRGEREAGIAKMRQANALWREQQAIAMVPLVDGLLAELEGKAGNAERAFAHLDAALSDSERSGQYWYEAELYRVRGELLLRGHAPDVAGAEAAFRRALEIARRQRTRSFELRAALALARLYEGAGRARAAKELLEPALAGFKESDEFPEVAEANRLLAGLSLEAGAAGGGQRLG